MTRWIYKFLLSFLAFHLFISSVWAQCPPTIAISPANAEITFDNFPEFSSGITRYGITYVDVTACGAAPVWDLSAQATLTQGVTFSSSGTPLSLDNIKIRASNSCSTPDQTYAIMPAANTRITQTFTTPLGNPSNARHYIVGSDIMDGALAANPASCAIIINQDGSPVTNASKNRFRIDISVVPGITTTIQPGIYDLMIEFFGDDDSDLSLSTFTSQSFSLQIEIMPVLELKMTSIPQIDFFFDNTTHYLSGVTRYGATQLEVNASVDWDLVAVASSTVNQSSAGANAYWDQNIAYSSSGTNQIPLRALELHQTPPNPSGSGAMLDYSLPFASPPSGNNYVTVGHEAGGDINLTGTRAIAGKPNMSGAGNSVIPGSFINNIGGGFNTSNYKYTIDYRLFPGLPATFNGLMGTSVQPGTYIMELRYIISEDQ